MFLGRYVYVQPSTVNLSGYSVSLRDVLNIDSDVYSENESTSSHYLYLQPNELNSESLTLSSLAVDGYGLRDLFAESLQESNLDLSVGGIAIYDEGVLVNPNTTSLNFKGADTVAKTGTTVAQVDIYSPPPQFSLTSFSVSPSLLEIGDISVSPVLTWAIVGNPETLSIDNGVGDVLGLTTKTLTNANIAANTTWTISGHSVDGDFTGSASLVFQPKVFTGRNTNASLTEAQVEALSGQLKGSRTGVYSFASDSPPSYIYFAWPQSFGLAGGFTDTSTNFNVAMEDVALLSITNSFGITMNYYVYRSTNQLGGAISVRVM